MALVGVVRTSTSATPDERTTAIGTVVNAVAIVGATGDGPGLGSAVASAPGPGLGPRSARSDPSGPVPATGRSVVAPAVGRGLSGSEADLVSVVAIGTRIAVARVRTGVGSKSRTSPRTAMTTSGMRMKTTCSALLKSRPRSLIIVTKIASLRSIMGQVIKY